VCPIPNCWTKHHAEDHLEAPRALDIDDDLLDDEEIRQYVGEANFILCVIIGVLHINVV
jgi:hypothetical protein